MTWPSISILMPTYNEEGILGKTLEALQKVRYPKDKLEIIIADGGSTDTTRSIAQKHHLTVLDNPQKLAEHGKRKAFEASKGEYIILLDADNIVSSSDWLEELVRAQKIAETRSSIAATESSYLIASDFASLNVYVALLVIADPLARMLAPRPVRIEREEGVLLKHYQKGQIPILGANGFLWPRRLIEQFNTSPDELNEVQLSRLITAQHNFVVGNIPSNGIYHYYCTGLKDYMTKRRKIGRKHSARAVQGNDWIKQNGQWRFLGAVLYLGTLIGPCFEALIQIIRSRRIEWAWHPLVGFLTIYTYVIITLNLHKAPTA